MTPSSSPWIPSPDMLADASAAGEDVDASLDPATDYSAALVRASDSDAIESVTNWINLYVRKVSAVRSSEALVGAAAGIRAHRGVAIGVLGATWLVLLGALIIVQVSLMNERMPGTRRVALDRGIAVRRQPRHAGRIGAAPRGGCTRGQSGLAALVLPLVGEGASSRLFMPPRRRCLSRACR